MNLTRRSVIITPMRCTVTIPDDLHAELKSLARRRNETLSATATAVLRAGLAELRQPYREKTYSMGKAKIDITKANRIAASMGDEKIVRKMREGW